MIMYSHVSEPCYCDIVCVRVRPFNVKELTRSDTSVLEVSNQQIEVLNPVTNNKVTKRLFKFDHCHWSTDKKHECYADQEKVYMDVGEPLMDNIFSGFNCSVLAYGYFYFLDIFTIYYQYSFLFAISYAGLVR